MYMGLSEASGKEISVHDSVVLFERIEALLSESGDKIILEGYAEYQPPVLQVFYNSFARL